MTSRDRRTVIWGAGALALLLLVWGVALPAWDHWSAMRQRITEARSDLRQVQEQEERLAALDRQLESVWGAAAKKALPAVEDGRMQFIKNLMDSASAAGVGIRNLQLEAARPVRELPGVMRIGAQVQATCPAQPLVKYLAAVKTSPGLLLLERVEVTAATSTPGSPGSPGGPGGGMPPGMSLPPGVSMPPGVRMAAGMRGGPMPGQGQGQGSEPANYNVTMVWSTLARQEGTR